MYQYQPISILGTRPPYPNQPIADQTPQARISTFHSQPIHHGHHSSTLLSKLHREFNQPLQVAFADLKLTFDHAATLKPALELNTTALHLGRCVLGSWQKTKTQNLSLGALTSKVQTSSWSGRVYLPQLSTCFNSQSMQYQQTYQHGHGIKPPESMVAVQNKPHKGKVIPILCLIHPILLLRVLDPAKGRLILEVGTKSLAYASLT